MVGRVGVILAIGREGVRIAFEHYEPSSDASHLPDTLWGLLQLRGSFVPGLEAPRRLLLHFHYL